MTQLIRSARRVLPYALVLAALGLRLHGLTFQSLWRDEVDAIRFAQAGSVTSLRQLGWNGPLYTWLLGLWLDWTGTSEFAARFSSLLAGVALTPVVYRLGAALSSRRTGLAAAALAAMSAYLTWYSQELKMYSLLALLGAASTTLLLRALQDGGRKRWSGYVLLTATLPYVHVLGVLLIPAHALAYLLAWPRSRPKLRPFALSLAVLVIPYVPLAAWQAPLLLNAFQTGHPYYPLPDMLEILARGWTLGIVASADARLMAPFALALAGLALRPRLDAGARFLIGWLTVPVLLVHLISLRAPVFTDRYLIASLPALLLLAAVGVERVSRRSWGAGLLVLAVTLAVQLHGIRQQASYSIKTDTRSAARIVQQQWQEGDLLLLQIPYLRYSMDYYLGEGYPILEGPFTNYGMSPEEAGRYFSVGTQAHQRVWLVLSEAEMWDHRGLTEAWLRQNAAILEEWELARLRLLKAELGSDAPAPAD